MVIMPSLRRVSDNSGDSGSYSRCMRMNGEEIEFGPDIPTVGWHIQVGSPFARSFSTQDWWRTNLITEILEDKTVPIPNSPETRREITFSTKSGSTYIWRE